MGKRGIHAAEESHRRSQLPRLRKAPLQSRSRALVDAVVEACMQILGEKGDAALTVNNIARVSGATVGSIYQYFANKEAILALVYEQVLIEEAERLRALGQRTMDFPLAKILPEILGNAIRVELRLHHLNKEFHLKYYSSLQFDMRCGSYSSAREYIESTWLRFIKHHVKDIDAIDWGATAYLLGRGLRAVIGAALEDDPVQLEQPEFLDGLVAMALGCLRLPANGGH
jgi:AcrR family transcriptional regulator